MGKRVPESAGQILNLPASKKICRINKRALGVTNLQHVTVAEGSEAFDGSRAGKRKHKPLTHHKPEEAGPKVILMYSDQHAAEVRLSQGTAKFLGEGRNQQGYHKGKQPEAQQFRVLCSLWKSVTI